MASSFRQRLLDAADELLAATGSAAMEDFSQKWSILCDDIESAFQVSNISDSDVALARSVAARVATVSDLFIDLEAVTSTVVQEFEQAFAKLSIEDTIYGETSTPSPLDTPHTVAVASAVPLYIAPAYQWLIDNIHDPYPSTSLKRALAEGAGLSVRSMDDWFKNIRRRIGWVDLCKQHFKGKRSMAVATAGKFFRGGGPAAVPDKVAQHLADIKFSLEKLAFSKTLLTDDSAERGGKPERSSRSLLRSSKSPDSPPLTEGPSGLCHFSTPSSSSPSRMSFNAPSSSPPSRMPSLGYWSSDSEDDEPLPEINLADVSLLGYKRERVTGESESRALKRRRYSDSEEAGDGTAVAVIKSPGTVDSSQEYYSQPSRRSLTSPVIRRHPPSVKSEPQECVPVLMPRPLKRRLSDTEVHAPSKRARTMTHDSHTSDHLTKRGPYPDSTKYSLGDDHSVLGSPIRDYVSNSHSQIDLSKAQSPATFAHALSSTSDAAKYLTRGRSLAHLRTSTLQQEVSTLTTYLSSSLFRILSAPQVSETGVVSDGSGASHVEIARIQEESTTRDFQSTAESTPVYMGSACESQDVGNTSKSPASEMSPAGEKDHSQGLLDMDPQAGSWPVISDAQWDEFIRLVNLGQEADVVSTPTTLESDSFSFHELFSEPPVDLAYDIVQGPIGPAIPQTFDVGPLNLDFDDLFDLSSYSTEVVGLPSLGDYQTELAAF